MEKYKQGFSWSLEQTASAANMFITVLKSEYQSKLDVAESKARSMTARTPTQSCLYAWNIAQLSA